MATTPENLRMKDLKTNCRLAIVQAAPVMFNKDACLQKALRLIEEAAKNGAELIVFPELFLPGYPYGMTFGYTVGSRKESGREDWKVYYDNSILADGEEMRQLIDCAKRLGVYLSFCYSEREENTATLYNSNMLISPEGQALNHRKLKPTGAERLVWGDAQQDFFPVMTRPGAKSEVSSAGRATCRSRAPRSTRRALRSTFRRTQMIIPSGSIPSVTSQSKATATL